MVAVHILDMEDGVGFMDVLSREDQLERNLRLVDESPQGVSAIDAQDVVLAQSAPQGEFDGGLGLIPQDRISDRSMPVPGHQDGDLLTGEPTPESFAAPLPGRPGKLPTALEGFQEIGFICLGYALELDGLVGCCGPKEAMTPSEGRGH